MILPVSIALASVIGANLYRHYVRYEPLLNGTGKLLLLALGGPIVWAFTLCILPWIITQHIRLFLVKRKLRHFLREAENKIRAAIEQSKKNRGVE